MRTKEIPHCDCPPLDSSQTAIDAAAQSGAIFCCPSLLATFIPPVEVFMYTTVSIMAEIPEELHESLTGYLETHPDWDYDRVLAAALSLFLLQNGTGETPETSRSYRRAARVYLDSLFKHAV
jgi:hypothetical protein